MTQICKSSGLTREHCVQCSKKVLAWTVVGNTFLVVVKLVGGVFTNSSGLIADGIQSIACVITSLMIMVTMSLSGRGHDEKFPYGYEKLEILATLVAFSVLIGIGIGIILSSVLAILKRDFVQPDIMSLPVAVLSVFLTFMIQRYNLCAGERLDSQAMVANACHAGADVFSSSAVIGGIVLSQFGPDFAICDKIAALLIGIVIIKDSLHHWTTSLRNILDGAPSEGFVQYIERMIIRAHPGYFPTVINFKRTGRKFWVGISLRCTAIATLHEANRQMEKMGRALVKEFPLIQQVDFFIEPS